MEIIQFDTVPSTSSFVTDQIKSGKAAPFAAVALEQSGGRGRRGRTWSSPLGGIYLSIAMPPPAIAAPLMGNMSLWVGMEISRWLELRFGLKASLKWPNDLMFDGRKLGGILIESGIEGQKQGPVVIGIGLNCENAPDVAPNDIDAQSIALSECCSTDEKLKAVELAEELIAHIEKAWNAPTFADALKHVERDFLNWSPPAMRLWIDRDQNEYWWLKEILKDGSLLLNQIGSATEKNVYSADHRLTVAKKLSPLPILLADVGNTSIKIHGYKSFWHAEPFIKIRHFHADRDFSALKAGLAEALKEMPKSGWPLFISGVAPRQIEILQTVATVAGFLPIEVRKQTVRVHGSYPVAQIGIDRLCLMEGWLSTQPEADDIALIASFGTALTVDIVKGSGRHLGGVIAPGVGLAATALHEYTGLLPLVAVKEHLKKELIGLSSREAIAAGIMGSSVGLIETLLRDVAQRESISLDKITVLFTGGDAELVKTYLPRAHLAPDLFFHGLKSVVAGGVFVSGI